MLAGDEFYGDEITSGPEPEYVEVPLSMLRCETCGALLDGLASDCGSCGEVIE